MYIYHITKKENLDSIMQYGLVPSKGTNSIIAREESEYVYLCPRDKVFEWYVTLQGSIILEVDTKGLDLLSDKEYNVPEIRYGKVIKPKYLKVIPIEEIGNLDAYMDEWYYSILSSISEYCLNYLKYYFQEASAYYYTKDDNYKSNLKSINNCANIIASVISNINLDEEKLHIAVNNLSEKGIFVFTDTIDSNIGEEFYHKRLWEVLPLYNDPDSYYDRLVLYNAIVNNLKEILYVNTGGWTL